MMREIALDTETTGFDPETGHRVVEIGCVEMRGRVRTGNFFHCYLNPQRAMPAEAFAVHGLSDQFLADKPLFAAEAQRFLDFIADSPLVIHNAQFDMKFLNAELKRVALPPLSMERAVDTVMIARRKFPGAPAKLDALCKRFNIDLSARVKHGALLDAELLADVYLELMGGRQEVMQLAAISVNVEVTVTEDGVAAAPAEPLWPARSFPPSAEELAAHEVFVAKLKNPIWAS